MVSTLSKYTIEPYNPEDESQVLDLLQGSLGDGISQWKDGRLWRWKHLANPFGPSYIIVAKNETGQVIGMRAMIGWSFTTGGRTLKSLRPVDTVTHPDYRGQGVFAELTKKGFSDAKNQGFETLITTSGQSRPTCSPSFPGLRRCLAASMSTSSVRWWTIPVRCCVTRGQGS